MIVKIISKEEAKKVLFNKEILARMRCIKEITLEDGEYIGGYLDDKLIAVGIYYKRKGFQSIHINVLKDYRGRFGVAFGKALLKLRGKNPLLTNVPTRCKDVVKFVRYFGFRLVGKNNDQLIYMKD